MGWENRDYARDSSYSGRFNPDWPIVCKYIIWANIIVFLAQIFYVRQMTQAEFFASYFSASAANTIAESADKLPVTRQLVDPEQTEANDLQPSHSSTADEEALLQFVSGMRPLISPVQKALEIDTRKIMRGQVWRLITGAFCHDRFFVWHLFFNMLAFYWCGLTLERMYGSREFFMFYFAAILFSSLAYVGLDLWLKDFVPAIGASGAVMAVFMLFAIHFPRHKFLLFFVIPVEARWLVVFYCIYDLHPVLLSLSGGTIYTGVAHAGHLGGLVFGYLYWRYQFRLENFIPNNDISRQQRSNKSVRPSTRNFERGPEPKLNALELDGPGIEESANDDGDDFDRQVDEILRKVNLSGKGSLTDEELEILNRASNWYKQREDL